MKKVIFYFILFTVAIFPASVYASFLNIEFSGKFNYGDSKHELFGESYLAKVAVPKSGVDLFPNSNVRTLYHYSNAESDFIVSFANNKDDLISTSPVNVEIFHCPTFDCYVDGIAVPIKGSYLLISTLIEGRIYTLYIQPPINTLNSAAMPSAQQLSMYQFALEVSSVDPNNDFSYVRSNLANGLNVSEVPLPATCLFFVFSLFSLFIKKVK